MGQAAGMQRWIHRLMAAWLHEILRAIQEHQAIVTSKEVRTLLPRSRPLRRAWQELVNLAVGDDDSSTFTRTLAQVRHNVAYHYYQPKVLMQGYRAHFLDGPRTRLNAAAYVSLGQSMEEPVSTSLTLRPCQLLTGSTGKRLEGICANHRK
jgi:hypothetical protein